MTCLCSHSGKAQRKLQSTCNLGERSTRLTAALTPRTPRNAWYPLYRRLGGSRGRSGRERKIAPQQGPDPRTIQPIASSCTLSRPPEKFTWLNYTYENYCRFDRSRYLLHWRPELNVRQNNSGKKNPAVVQLMDIIAVWLMDIVFFLQDWGTHCM